MISFCQAYRRRVLTVIRCRLLTHLRVPLEDIWLHGTMMSGPHCGMYSWCWCHWCRGGVKAIAVWWFQSPQWSLFESCGWCSFGCAGSGFLVSSVRCFFWCAGHPSRSVCAVEIRSPEPVALSWTKEEERARKSSDQRGEGNLHTISIFYLWHLWSRDHHFLEIPDFIVCWKECWS